MRNLALSLLIIASLLAVFLPIHALAHEVYVLSPDAAARDLAAPNNIRDFQAAFTPQNIKLSMIIGLGIFVALLSSLVLSQSAWGKQTDQKLKRLSHWGSLIVRVALAVSLFYSAYSRSFLGPELHLSSLVWPTLV